MTKLKSLHWLGIIASTLFSIATFADTEVTYFHPFVPPGKAQNGHCWASSIASPRSDAWRCMVDNAIYDPCFTTTDKNNVVCGFNPAINQMGFLLNLTQPLPQANVFTPKTIRPWLIMLADGSTCRPFTGTLAAIHHQPVEYGCSDSKPCNANGACTFLTGILGEPKQGTTWTAQKVIYAVSPTGNLTLKQQSTVTISKAWQ
jgi:hypothetical protein